MLRALVAGFFQVVLICGALAQTVGGSPNFNVPLNPSGVDLAGDSRSTDAFVNTSQGSQFGFQQTNWFVQANALAGNRWQIGLNVAASGCRTDQFMGATNLAPAAASQAGWLAVGYPIINNMAAQTGNSTPVSNSCSNTPQTFPYTDNNGNVITMSNLAAFAIADITNGIQPFLARGKKIVISAEPGNVSTSNTAATVGTGTGSITTTVFTVTACTACFFQSGQSLQTSGGSAITAGSRLIGDANTNPSACSPACTGAGGIGTYAVNISQTVTSETINGQYSLLAVKYEFNSRLQALANAYPGQVYYWDPNPCLLNPTGSATVNTFRTNILLDNLTHFNNLGGYYGGTCFNATGIPNLVPTPATLLTAIQGNAANPRELINSPLFNTATGGAVSTCTVSGGNATPPPSLTAICGQASTTITMTTAAEGSTPSYGNALTINIVSTVADTFRLRSDETSINRWNLTDWLQSSFLVTVAAGSSHCSVFGDNAINTNPGSVTLNSWGMYGAAPQTGGGTNDGPTTAYTYTIGTPWAQPSAGATSKGFFTPFVYVGLTAAGNCQITLSRWSAPRGFRYASGVYTGQ